MIGAFAGSAHAIESRVNDGSVSALSSYVQSIASATTLSQKSSDPYVRLRDFVQGIGAERAQPISMPKLAEADNAIDAVKPSGPVVEASYVG
jgi:hypothetical protein